jgi:hypothetical protein
MRISENTRRDIIDELKISKITWHGRLNDIDFLMRIFPLQTMPSSDGRFKNMCEDIKQHRINFSD